MNSWWVKYNRALIPNNNPRLNVLDINMPQPTNKLKPIDAALIAVSDIIKNNPPPYNLLASGGIDSQCMILAWLKSGVEFNVIHYSYNNYNSEDTNSLNLFCDLYNIESEIRVFDVDNFINSQEYIDLAKKYDCASPHILTYIKIASLTSGTIVMAGNYVSHPNTYTSGLNYTILALHRYALDRMNFIPFFLLHTPELAFSFLDTDNYYQSYAITEKISNFDYFAKCQTYNSAGFGIIPQANKLTGFEQIKIKYDNVYVKPALYLRFRSENSKRPFDLLFRYSLFDVIGKYSEHFSINMQSTPTKE